MVPLKRRKTASSARGGTDGAGTAARFPEVVLFLLERKMGASRRTFLSQLGLKKGFQVEEEFSGRVTHVISESNSGDEVRRWLSSQEAGRAVAPGVQLLDVSWFTESMGAGRPVQVEDRHRLQEQQVNQAAVVSFSLPIYACQRRTTLDNHNATLTDALSLLAENAELNEEEGRGVAFRRAAAVLKALPAQVTQAWQLHGLPCLGDHSLRVVKDVLENGASSEVEATKRSAQFKALKVLTGVFGVGPKTAARWIRAGIHDVRQLRDSGETLNRTQQAGLDHYDDLRRQVTRTEADAIAVTVRSAVEAARPGAQVTLTGGFRRGKPTGHDVDFLITHPQEGREVGLMPAVVAWLESKGFLLYQKTTRNHYLESKHGPGRPSSNMDRFERCLAIFRLAERDHRPGSTEPAERTSGGEEDGQAEPGAGRQWRAVRVDLVVSPVSQFSFALLGWTGSKLFERELRRWAGHERAMSLSSHALYDNKQNKYVRAGSEEEIFRLLGLDFIAPTDRNA